MKGNLLYQTTRINFVFWNFLIYFAEVITLHILFCFSQILLHNWTIKNTRVVIKWHNRVENVCIDCDISLTWTVDLQVQKTNGVLGVQGNPTISHDGTLQLEKTIFSTAQSLIMTLRWIIRDDISKKFKRSNMHYLHKSNLYQIAFFIRVICVFAISWKEITTFHFNTVILCSHQRENVREM